MKFWSMEEKIWLENNYRKSVQGKPMTRKQCADHLGRTRGSVEGMIKTLALDGTQCYKRWTPEEEHELKCMFAYTNMKKLARVLRCTPSQIEWKLRRMKWTRAKAIEFCSTNGYHSEAIMGRPWFEADVQELKKLYGTMPIEELAKVIRRTEQAIYKKVTRAKLHIKPRIQWTANTIHDVKYRYATMTAEAIAKDLKLPRSTVFSMLYRLKFSKVKAKRYRNESDSKNLPAPTLPIAGEVVTNSKSA